VHGQPLASSFCDPAPLHALWVYAAGVMQNCLRWSGCQPPALPGRYAPAVQPSVALVVCWRCGTYQALCALFLVSGLRPVILSEPRPPNGLAAARHWPCAGLPVRPQGAPSEPRQVRSAINHQIAIAPSRRKAVPRTMARTCAFGCAPGAFSVNLSSRQSHAAFQLNNKVRFSCKRKGSDCVCDF
jgi:hypothetical protein